MTRGNYFKGQLDVLKSRESLAHLELRVGIRHTGVRLKVKSKTSQFSFFKTELTKLSLLPWKVLEPDLCFRLQHRTGVAVRRLRGVLPAHGTSMGLGLHFLVFNQSVRTILQMVSHGPPEPSGWGRRPSPAAAKHLQTAILLLHSCCELLFLEDCIQFMPNMPSVLSK